MATSSFPPSPTPPEPRRFYVRKDRLLDIASASLGTLSRFGFGAFAAGYKTGLVSDSADAYSIVHGIAGSKMLSETSAVAEFPRPAQPIILYEFDACPFCRKVREACSYLDLDVNFFPTTDRSEKADNWRAAARALAAEKGLAGRQRFPLLLDPNTGEHAERPSRVFG